MCLDIEAHCNNQNIIKAQNFFENRELIMNPESVQTRNVASIKSLCGGSLIEHKPLFDPAGQLIFIVRNDKIRIYSVETGELVRELSENRDGVIKGMFMNPENDQLVCCTESGTLLFWKLSSCIITKRIKLALNNQESVQKFILTVIDSTLHGLFHLDGGQSGSQFVLIELTKGKTTYNYDLKFATALPNIKVKMANGNGFMAVICKKYLYVIEKSTNAVILHSQQNPLNSVACHPVEQCIATGDIQGKIKLWNNIFQQNPVYTVLHWHHMIVLSLEFSQSGTVLYSGGAECTLVKWQIREKTLDKNFLPRLTGSIKQISVATKHDKIVICLDDNAIQVINSSLNQLKTIQDFTKISPFDLGFNQAFPAGINIDPKNQLLVLNGRIGHLQFFSTKTLRMLFNLDITMRNPVPRKVKTLHFSTDVMRTAFSHCGTWLATVETWNDKIYSPELRLKFWKFLPSQQTYVLHTQIEQAHQKNVISIEFASNKKSPVCATAGEDRVIKIWSLEASEEIKNPKMIWMLIEQLSYKNLPVTSLSFSQDSSLLIGSFGNALCIYDSYSFKLKCVLSAPAPVEGSVNRVLISLPLKKHIKSNISNLLDKRQKMLHMMETVIRDPKTSSNLLKNITKEKTRFFTQKSPEKVRSKDLKLNEKRLIFSRVLSNSELNFNEKLQVLHKLNIYYKIVSQMELEVFDFISKQATEEQQLYKGLHRSINLIKNDAKYKIQWRFKVWKMRDLRRNRKIVTVRKLLKQPIAEGAIKEKNESYLPIKNITQITDVIFCNDELSHIVVVTTSTRILIWNLLTLKIQGSFKIHAKIIARDPTTNLIAVFTKYNELFIIHPSPALTIFHQTKVPDIHSAIWIPRENSKNQSLSVNWQARSQLLFLTQNQDICCFNSPVDEEIIDLSSYMDTQQFVYNTPFAAILTKKVVSDKSTEATIKKIISNAMGNNREIINLSNHAMPPTRFLTKDFIASLLTSEHSKHLEKAKLLGKMQGENAIEASDDEGGNEKATCKTLIESEEKLLKTQINKRKEAITYIESKLKNLSFSDENVVNEFTI